MESTRRPIEDSLRHTPAEEALDSRASARARTSCSGKAGLRTPEDNSFAQRCHKRTQQAETQHARTEAVAALWVGGGFLRRFKALKKSPRVLNLQQWSVLGRLLLHLLQQPLDLFPQFCLQLRLDDVGQCG